MNIIYIDGFFVHAHCYTSRKEEEEQKMPEILTDICFTRINRKSVDLFDNRLFFAVLCFPMIYSHEK